MVGKPFICNVFADDFSFATTECLCLPMDRRHICVPAHTAGVSAATTLRIMKLMLWT